MFKLVEIHKHCLNDNGNYDTDYCTAKLTLVTDIPGVSDKVIQTNISII